MLWWHRFHVKRRPQQAHFTREEHGTMTKAKTKATQQTPKPAPVDGKTLLKRLEGGKTTLAYEMKARKLTSSTALRDALLAALGVTRVRELSATAKARYRKLLAPTPPSATPNA
jgi:hypothetical protein